MPPVSAGTAYIDIRPDFSQFASRVQSGLAPATKQVATSTASAVTKETTGLKTKLLSIGQGVGGLVAGAAIGTAVLGFVRSAISAAEEAQTVARQTDAVLKSTGGAAGVTADHVAALADRLSKVAAVDDEVIAQGENVLLTFVKIRNEVGKGNDIFDQATQAALDLAAGMHQDLQSAVLQVGKALNDPVKGLTALGRAGVQFDEQQKEMVKTLVESGDQLGAQKIILGELTRQFEGAAAANATATEKMKVAFDDIAETVGGLLLPVMDKLSTVLVALSPVVKVLAANIDLLIAAFVGAQFAKVLTNIAGLGKATLAVKLQFAALAAAAVIAVRGIAAAFRDAGDIVEGVGAELGRKITDDLTAQLEEVAGNESIGSKFIKNVAGLFSGQGPNQQVLEEATQQFGDYVADLVGDGLSKSKAGSIVAQALTFAVEQGLSFSDPRVGDFINRIEYQLDRFDFPKQMDRWAGATAQAQEIMARRFARVADDARHVARAITTHLGRSGGVFAGMRVKVNNLGEAIATWAGMTRHQVRRWANGVVDAASEAINAFTGYTKVTKDSAKEAVATANKQVQAAKQYREGAKAIIDSDYPAKIKAQVLNAGPEIVRQWGIMSDKQRDSFVQALQRTTAIMEETRKTIVGKISDAMDEVERQTEKPVEIAVDTNTSAATNHLNEWLTKVQGTHVQIPVDAIFAQAGGGVQKAEGGRIPGYGGGDKVRAMLEPGEWVVRKEAVSKYGPDMMDRINTMRFARGGRVGAIDDHGWGLTYTLSQSDLYGAVLQAAKAAFKDAFPSGAAPGGLTPKAGEYYGAIQSLFHPPIMSTGPSIRPIIGTNIWSQHAYGNALDITNSFSSGPDSFKQTIADWLVEMQNLRRDIHYIAYNNVGHVIGGTTGVTSPHTNHVHADFYPQYAGDPYSGGYPIGGRARGGPVKRGSSYLVGEEGPEMFIPSQSGYIAPRMKVDVHITGGTLKLHRDSRVVLEDIAAEVASQVVDYRSRR